MPVCKVPLKKMIARPITFILLSLLLVQGCDALTRAKHSIQGIAKITPAELKELLNSKDITILDVRDAGDWDASDVKIPGAKRESPYNVTAWMGNYQKDQRLVLY